MAGCLARKTEPGVIVFVTHDNHNSLAASAKLTKAMPDQMTANATPLMAWTHGHGSQGNRWQRSLRGFDIHSTEQDMANDLALDFSHERKKDDSLFPQSVNQIGLIGAFESGLVHLPNLGAVPQPLVPAVEIQLRHHRYSCTATMTCQSGRGRRLAPVQPRQNHPRRHVIIL